MQHRVHTLRCNTCAALCALQHAPEYFAQALLFHKHLLTSLYDSGKPYADLSAWQVQQEILINLQGI